MYGDQTSARWIAVVGGVVLLSTCAACLLLTVLLSSAYGGQTIALRNPFAPQINVEVVDGGGSSDSGTSSTGDTSGSANSTSGGTSSTTNTTIPTGTDATSYLPPLSGYTAVSASSIEGAFDFVFGAQSSESDFSAQSLSLTTIATSVLVARLDEFITCYRQTGAVDAQVYVQADVAAIAAGEVPPMGAVVVANTDILRDSLVACAVSPNDPNSFSAQSANQPCGNFGTFTANGDNFTYVYAGTATSFCTAVETHFGAFGG
ncbi:MAG: hypothetical protein AAF125_12900 [Chloroflexota bacterium]